MIALTEKNHDLLTVTFNLTLFLFLNVSIWMRRSAIT